MKRRGRERGRKPVSAEINVTSLVDVAFTLLIIFIITAPVLQGGVEVSVPQGPVQVVEATDDLVIVTITVDRGIFIGEAPVALDDLRTALEQVIRTRNTDMVYLKGDSLAYYGSVARVISEVAAHEGVRLSLILEEIGR